jgi:hypothetical protein
VVGPMPRDENRLVITLRFNASTLRDLRMNGASERFLPVIGRLPCRTFCPAGTGGERSTSPVRPESTPGHRITGRTAA